jgi:hypothetical protein
LDNALKWNNCSRLTNGGNRCDGPAGWQNSMKIMLSTDKKKKNHRWWILLFLLIVVGLRLASWSFKYFASQA